MLVTFRHDFCCLYCWVGLVVCLFSLLFFCSSRFLFLEVRDFVGFVFFGFVFFFSWLFVLLDFLIANCYMVSRKNLLKFVEVKYVINRNIYLKFLINGNKNDHTFQCICIVLSLEKLATEFVIAEVYRNQQVHVHFLMQFSVVELSFISFIMYLPCVNLSIFLVLLKFSQTLISEHSTEKNK